jgi:hypothetical protein
LASEAWFHTTRLYQHWERRRHEILAHKWYESEKAGRDIGWERAATDWLVRFGRIPTDDSAR